MAKNNKNYVYAYFLLETKESGVVDSWDVCAQIIQHKGHKVKKFEQRAEAQAWLKRVEISPETAYEKPPLLLKEGVYFDSGTGAGGVQISVCDESKTPLLSHLVHPVLLTEDGFLKFPREITNNYGELLALFYAMHIAQKLQKTSIFGDSQLILNYWSKGHYQKTLPKKTQILIRKVSHLRAKMEKQNYRFEIISGDDNPADLGYHRS